MRRPWVVMLTSFALVMGLGGLALAAGGVPFIDAGNADGPVAESLEPEKADFPDLPAADRAEDKVKDEPVKDEPVKDEPVKDEPVKDEPVKDEPVNDEPVKAEPPELAILYPENGAKVDGEKLVFEGKTTPGARVFAGKWEADVNDDGGWRIVLFLEPGTQTAKFHAESDGGVAEATVSVTRIVADKPEPKEEEPKDEPAYELVAHQVYGVCESELPYDVFHGETKPGAYVLVWSEYGSADTYANDDGRFEVRVDFPEAPYGKTIQVKVKSIEQKRYFEFTSYGNPPPDAGGDEPA